MKIERQKPCEDVRKIIKYYVSLSLSLLEFHIYIHPTSNSHTYIYIYSGVRGSTLLLTAGLPPQPPLMKVELMKKTNTTYEMFGQWEMTPAMRRSSVNAYEIECEHKCIRDCTTPNKTTTTLLSSDQIRIGMKLKFQKLFEINDIEECTHVFSLRLYGINMFGRGPPSVTQHVTLYSEKQKRKDLENEKEKRKREKLKPLRRVTRKRERWEQRTNDLFDMVTRCVLKLLGEDDDDEEEEEEDPVLVEDVVSELVQAIPRLERSVKELMIALKNERMMMSKNDEKVSSSSSSSVVDLIESVNGFLMHEYPDLVMLCSNKEEEIPCERVLEILWGEEDVSSS